MTWWLVFLVMTSPGEWEVPPGFFPRAQHDLDTCVFRGREWQRGLGIAENEALACIPATSSDAAVARMISEIPANIGG